MNMRFNINEQFVKRVADLIDPEKSIFVEKDREAFKALIKLSPRLDGTEGLQERYRGLFVRANRKASKTFMKSFDVNNDGIIDSKDLKWFSDNVGQPMEVELDEADRRILKSVQRLYGRKKSAPSGAWGEPTWQMRIAKETGLWNSEALQRIWKLETLEVIYHEDEPVFDATPARRINWKRAEIKRPLFIGF
jgi:hypothetical protein